MLNSKRCPRLKSSIRLVFIRSPWVQIDATRTRGPRAVGTFEFESASAVYTELQCGSYIFMDADYGRDLDRDGAPTNLFEPGLGGDLIEILSGLPVYRRSHGRGSCSLRRDTGLTSMSASCWRACARS